MKRFILALVLVGCMVGLASASHCRVVGQQIVAQPVLLAQQILVPAYGGSYGQPAQQQGPGYIDPDLIRRLVEYLERQEAREQAGPGGHTAASIMQQQCAKCHTEGQQPRGDFMLFNRDGAPLELSIRDKSAVRRAVTSTDLNQRMPPERPLSQALQSVLIQSLKGQ